MTLRADVFPKLLIVQDVVRPMSKNRRVRTHLDSQHVKESQTLVKFSWQHLCQIFFITVGETDLENVSVSDIWNLMTLYTLTADDK